uniref:AAA+ ATPase domain-containing protein n=1 Tax=Grammatophora oceanica TaxID=210454 RepID=A0A7S1Y8A3_9STRA|mmetsp:Transcript_35183/g.52301  ORF Transcript_35183/g.52301 Transcript_35183/m.52301 type:complete len:2810 (+) Transcript_35183:3-8432(+)
MLWDHGVIARKKEMGEILRTAQGEMALEIFLGQVRDRWMKQELELVLYQNRVRLIRGWDDLFSTLDDHTGGLVLMKSSPYYRSVREFQEDGNLWEDRLTKLRAIFDMWVDVQRRWVYLEGILFGSTDIKAQLPTEYSRFKSVDSEFVALMRRIASRPYAMEALNVENLLRTLERLGNLMGIIQRALGDYLEKQRSDFSRFYFLGDDDLLEIIGNSGEPGKVIAHVGKMFAGIGGARQSTEALPEGCLTRLDAMVSKDGEVVPFYKPIDIAKDTGVKFWLKELEDRMHTTLAMLLEQAVKEDATTEKSPSTEEGRDAFIAWASKFPAQIVILATQVNWSMGVESALEGSGGTDWTLKSALEGVEGKLGVMAETVLKRDLPNALRKTYEQLITELVHQRDVTRDLLDAGVSDTRDFRWLYHLRYKYNPAASNLTEKLTISLSNATFHYGFEYLGIGERLVQTPLTDKCYLTLTQALHFRMGGNPFGPAGTGKTESVKALGAQLGRFVLVQNCDESFDFSAMGRIFSGLCQVGAWGCFDEFNRLEERILSAVSQQILSIQRGLIERQSNVELLGRSIRLHDNVGIFVTMNPGYAGRSNLPDNLKTLFRSVAMVVPDRKLIAQVMFYSQGIVTAETLAGKVVDLFLRCEARMSKMAHYDFGLRALKTLLVSVGTLKRQALEGRTGVEGEELESIERDVLIKGACNNLLPKLVQEDFNVFTEVLQETFPGAEVARMEDSSLRKQIESICNEKDLVVAEAFVQKVLQLNMVIQMRHGIMMVGPVGGGKSVALKTLQRALTEIDGSKVNMYVIDPKAMSKERLYGTLDGTTMEWTDGVFTSLLRRILDNQKGESEQRHWIVFDGDVDPEWAENLNSVLDDNKLLTLPSGERLGIPDNVRIILEVDSLAFATPATVSRCGMIWFSAENVTTEMCLEGMIRRLAKMDLMGDRATGDEIPLSQTQFVDAIKPQFLSERTSSLVVDALEFAMEQPHVMEPSRDRLLQTLETLLVQGIKLTIEYDENHPDFPMSKDHNEKYAKKWLLHSLLWSFAGSASWESRMKFSDMLVRTSGVVLPDKEANLFDYRPRVQDGDFELWSDSVPRMEIESHKVSATDVVIPTTDTARHSDVLGAWLSSRQPLILCGPPGSGKTMTLTSVLQSVQGVVLASLNFSSRTSVEIILKTFAQYCSYVRRGKDICLEPVDSLGAKVWLVVFCDEINLPEEDSYGTQRVIMFMRQLVEQGGFWREDNVWVKTERIQFVGACNPPTDAGRYDMAHRFLRHVPLLLVDFPAKDSLMQIYRTFNGGMLKLFPNLKGETDALTEAMVDVYLQNQGRFKPDDQPQYFYSPRELSRWVRGIYEAVVNLDQGLTREEFVRIWAHEALRLFNDRLVGEEDRKWCDELIDNVAKKHFANCDFDVALKRPLFYTSWMSKETKKVERAELKNFLAARLATFYEEELDVKLVVFDEVLQHVLRLDRVLRQPMGHCLLVGDSGAGKTVLSKFVSWMNGLSIFQIKAHSRYGIEDFNEDLRAVMRRVGVDGEKICFIFDECNVLGSGFLEAMNALLASGEVPGLFENDEYNSLMSACRDSAARDGVIIDSDDELWRRFTSIVQRNLHVVFTMNPSGGEWKTRSTTSPALFNRCVVDWFGTWGDKAMGEVGKEFTVPLDIGDAEAVGGSWGIGDGEMLMEKVAGAFEDTAAGGLRQAVVAALVDLHQTTKSTAEDMARSESTASRTYLSPRDYLALINNFVSCTQKRRAKLEDEQLHVNAGLEKMHQTKENVSDLKVKLGEKTKELKEKESLANKKLQQMVADQNIAEKRKVEAERMNVEVEKQQTEINARKEEAQRDLDTAEPALKSAQQSVRGIKKRDLDEVRNLARPPNNVKLTLECVAIMMGEKKWEWGDVRKMLSKSEFIPNILNFDADKLTSKQIKMVQDKYLDGNASLTVETVTRSSRACGPLYSWAESQIKYSTVYNRIQPLREEVEQLEKQASAVTEEKERIEAEVDELEKSITQYKTDYANLIRDVETLKTEMKVVSVKVDRAQSLLQSLGQESERWSKSSESFQTLLRSLVGDGLILAAFLTYSGFFDFKTRLSLVSTWKKSLDSLGIEYREDLAILECLSTASQRLTWQSGGLPGDSLSLENGIILDQCERFPFVIDPSGKAMDFLMSKYDKIQKTSFLDKAFMKTLIGAVRFGTTLLVENVESVDPVLNPVLNREIQRTGGRSLVRIGTEDVDYSPKFHVIMSTKNPAVQLTPDLCSRVTLVNFTVTPDSLQSQCLSSIVKSEKPELETRRGELLKLQGEQNVKLRELEDQMLAKISAVEGSILDDDKVVDGMEVLMKEGGAVEEQISKSAEVMGEVEAAVGKFDPLAALCRELFVLFAAMREVFFLYEFSSTTFSSILRHVLETNERASDVDLEVRIKVLKRALFQETAARIGRGLQKEDKIVFALHLAKLFKSDGEQLLDDGNPPESTYPLVGLVEETFGDDFPWQGRGLNALQEITLNEVDCGSPLMLCSAPGHDVSGRVEAMARELHKELFSVAMGSSEGFRSAEQFVNTASKRGQWVLLKNCHLGTDWLRETLVKKLQSFGSTAHKDFRLFITSEINPKLPTALLRISDIIVAEAPSGVKASLSRFMSSIPSDRFQNSVTNRLYLILAWVHAVTQERLRFVPQGWSESYGFTESDALHALDVIDALLSEVSNKKAQLDPDKIPWDGIQETLCKGVFGGRVTKPADQEILDNLVCGVFTPKCFDVNFKLGESDDAPTLPEGSSKEEVFRWIESLPSQTPPTWIGLGSDAEAVREKKIAENVVEKFKVVGDSLSA